MPIKFKQKSTAPKQQNLAQEKIYAQKKQPIIKTTIQQDPSEISKVVFNALEQAPLETAPILTTAGILVGLAKKRHELEVTLNTTKDLPGILRDIASKSNVHRIPLIKDLQNYLLHSNLELKDFVLNMVKKYLDSIVETNNKTLIEKGLHKLADTIEIIFELEQIRTIAKQLPEQYDIQVRANNILKEVEILLESNKHSDSDLTAIINKLKIIKTLGESTEIVKNILQLKANIKNIPTQEEVQKHAANILENTEKLLNGLGSESANTNSYLTRIIRNLKNIEALEQSKAIPDFTEKLGTLRQKINELNELDDDSKILLGAFQKSVANLIQRERDKLYSDDSKIIEKIDTVDLEKMTQAINKCDAIKEMTVKFSSLKIAVAGLPDKKGVYKYLKNYLDNTELLFARLDINNPDDTQRDIDGSIKMIADILDKAKDMSSFSAPAIIIKVDASIGQFEEYVNNAYKNVEQIEQKLSQNHEVTHELDVLKNDMPCINSGRDSLTKPQKILADCIKKFQVFEEQLDSLNLIIKCPINIIDNKLVEKQLCRLGMLIQNNIKVIDKSIDEQLTSLSLLIRQSIAAGQPIKNDQSIKDAVNKLNNAIANKLINVAVILFNENEEAINELIEWNTSIYRGSKESRYLLEKRLKIELNRVNQQFNKGKEIVYKVERISNDFYDELKNKNQEELASEIKNNYNQANNILNKIGAELIDLQNQISDYRKSWRYRFSFIFSLGGVNKKLISTQQQIEGILSVNQQKIKTNNLQKVRDLSDKGVNLEGLDRSNKSRRETSLIEHEIRPSIENIKKDLREQSKFFKK